MALRDFELGMDNASSEPLVDVALLLTACSFTLLVGVIIGYYVETFFKKQKLFGAIDGAPSVAKMDDRIESAYEGAGNGDNGASDAAVNLKAQYLQRAATQSAASALDAKLLSTKPSKVPKHIAVIMDGNRRFGRHKHGNALQGHWAGGQTLVDFIQWCKEDGVQFITAYAFSTENWSRDPLEVQTLMAIFAKYAESFRAEALTHNIKVNVLTTDAEKLPENVRASIRELQAATAHCTACTVNICLSYGSRGDIVNACRSVAAQVQAGQLSPAHIQEQHIAAALCASQYPDPDILIRTSGEYRLSNFLLWQMAYTEMFFVDKLWPQLTKQDYRQILHQYASQRSRRFGL